MRRRALFTVMCAALAWAAFVSLTTAQQPPAGAQGGGRGGRQGGPPAVQLPEGEGRQQVEAACARCHGFNMIAGSWGYTKDGWQDRIATMIKLPGADLEAISSYLAAHYPVRNVPGAVMISGPATITIKEWLAPTLGSRPHDSHAGADGSIWWTGQYAHKLGRLDPRSGEMREFDLPPNSQPHGLTEDRQGSIWYTGIQKGVIGRLEPRSGQVKEYPITEAGVRGPHTPVFDTKTGNLFFTLQSGHVGRLDTATGTFTIKKTPSDNTYPYGIRLNSQGVPWFVDFRGNRVGSVDPRTMEIKEYSLPHADARPRRLTITEDDVIWYSDYARGMLGRFDPKTGQVKEWPSPSGKDSQPYGITSIAGVIWYSESGVRPNTMVRFDPRSEKFQTFAIPSGGGVLRHFVSTPKGAIVTANSGVNKIGLVEIGTLATNRTN